MKVLSIIMEELTSLQSLVDSFTDDEWKVIAGYLYAKQRGRGNVQAGIEKIRGENQPDKFAMASNRILNRLIRIRDLSVLAYTQRISAINYLPLTRVETWDGVKQFFDRILEQAKETDVATGILSAEERDNQTKANIVAAGIRETSITYIMQGLMAVKSKAEFNKLKTDYKTNQHVNSPNVTDDLIKDLESLPPKLLKRVNDYLIEKGYIDNNLNGIGDSGTPNLELSWDSMYPNEKDKVLTEDEALEYTQDIMRQWQRTQGDDFLRRLTGNKPGTDEPTSSKQIFDGIKKQLRKRLDAGKLTVGLFESIMQTMFNTLVRQ